MESENEFAIMFAMTETVQLSIVALANVVLLAVLGIAGTIVKEYLDERRAKRIATKLAISDELHAEQFGGLADKLDDNAKKIGQIEKQTNSMKDALVKVTGEKSLAEGIAIGRAEHKAETDKKGGDV